MVPRTVSTTSRNVRGHKTSVTTGKVTGCNDSMPVGNVIGCLDPFLRCPTIVEQPSFEGDADSGINCGTSCGESDETASDSLSVTETRSEVSSDDMGSTVSALSGYEYDHLMKFHCKEFHPGIRNGQKDDCTTLAVIERSSPTSPIVSRKGSMRGVRGRVRAAIATFKETEENLNAKNFLFMERGKVVLYVTSLAVCRGPFLRCLEIRKIFHNLMVKFTECDLYMNREYQQDVRDRLGADKADGVPHLFIEGHYVGDFETILNLNESGQLRAMLTPYKRFGVIPPCKQCGGFTVIPCIVCSGSKRSNHRNSFTDQFHALRCSSCDFNGLQQCPLCTQPEKA